MKRQVYDAMFQTLAESFENSEQEMLASLQCEDFKEGVAHFIEKAGSGLHWKIERVMDFELSAKTQELQLRLQSFMDAHVYPNEYRFHEEVERERWKPTRIVEELKLKATPRGIVEFVLARRRMRSGG